MKGWSEDELETAARMYAAGESYKSIGASLHKHPGTVWSYIRTHPEFFQEPPGKAACRQIPRGTRRCHDCGRPHDRLSLPCVLGAPETCGRICPHGRGF